MTSFWENWPILLMILAGAALLVAAKKWLTTGRYRDPDGNQMLWIYRQMETRQIISHKGRTIKNRPEDLDDTRPFLYFNLAKPNLCRGFAANGETWGLDIIGQAPRGGTGNITPIFALKDCHGGSQHFDLNELWIVPSVGPSTMLHYLFFALEEGSFYATFYKTEIKGQSLRQYQRWQAQQRN